MYTCGHVLISNLGLPTFQFPGKSFLVGGFNPSEKYQSKWQSSPNRGENKKYLKPDYLVFLFLPDKLCILRSKHMFERTTLQGTITYSIPPVGKGKNHLQQCLGRRICEFPGEYGICEVISDFLTPKTRDISKVSKESQEHGTKNPIFIAFPRKPPKI